MISFADITAARHRIEGRIRRTPVFEAAPDLVFKLEYLQHTGSFKARGALNNVLAAAERGDLGPAGVIAASGGNAGLAVAWAAAQVGVPAEIHVPATAPAVKVKRLQSLGATVVQTGSEYSHALAASTDRAAQTGAFVCHAYDQREMVAGAGTIALELLEDAAAPVDTVLVAVGGGGLVGGIAAALADTPLRVVAVEPVAAPTLHTALDRGGPVDVEVGGYAADSLGARRAGAIAYAVAAHTGLVSVLVEDAAIRDARQRLWDEWRIVAEPGAAAAYAGLTAYRPADGERVAVVVCGANTDPGDL
ncbi:MAG: serine/threonine dehydratase [Hamadaea sp.]|uniref:serine/threonine dehydratase n=1 Tax=Hamadaea sp. TaxID=2024425 RepID=UPI0017FC06C2|nr:serine/threonine dehydratase [Hamadaea sp.]NUT23365.1 serine/threonine dehydratase [Hamadaea sp.]